MYNPTLREFSILFKKIFTDVILKYKYVAVFSSVCSLLAFISTYYFAKIAEASAVLLDKSSPIPFETRLMNLAEITLISLSLRYIPMCFFTFLIQLISRNKFVENLKTYMALPYSKFHSKTPGEIRFTIFLKSLSYPICAQIVVFDLVTLFGTSLFTFLRAYNDINIYAALIFPVFPVVYGMATLIFLKYKIIYNTINLEEQEKTSARIYDKLSNYDVIKTFNLEENEIATFGDSLGPQTECQLNSDIFFAKGKYVIRFITMLPYLVLGLISFVSPKLMSGKILFQAILLFTSLSTQIKKMGMQLSRLANLLNQIRFDAIEEETVHNLDNNKESFDRSIRFENVNLYHNDKCIIANINLTINKGETVAVIGKNGTGKSTFIKSILGFTKYTGEIFIDGSNLKNLSNKSVFRLISYIPQDDYTSDDTVLNNLKLGKRDATRRYIEEKAKLFKAHDTFINLEHGYETQAGIKGNCLSGGQKQKISIVRAAIKDAPIFILDEATAAIDKGYSKTVMNIFLNHMKNKTVMMIIHEKDYLPMFDKIVFLNDGRVDRCGSYEELCNTSKEFRDFVDK